MTCYYDTCSSLQLARSSMKKFKHQFEDILIVLFSKFKRRRKEVFKMTKKAANF